MRLCVYAFMRLIVYKKNKSTVQQINSIRDSFLIEDINFMQGVLGI